MTPAQHKTEAEAGLTRIASSTIITSDGDQLLAEAHAHLSKALGTGTHYTAADTLLASLPVPAVEQVKLSVGNQALLRAVLADR